VMLTYPNNLPPLHFHSNMALLNQNFQRSSSELASFSRNQLTNLSKCLQERKTPKFAKATLTINSLLQQLDFETNKPTNLPHKRVFQHFFNPQDLDCPDKKIKLDEDKSNLSTEDENQSRKDFHKLNSPQYISDNISKDLFGIQKINQELKPVLFEKGVLSSKKNRVENVTFSTEQNKLIFKVAFHVDNEEKGLRTLNREELLKEDPLLLLSFYENHLQFVKTPDFQPNSLKKL